MSTVPHRSNNFDLIRLLAAIQVVLSHAVGHTNLINVIPPWTKSLFEYMTWLPGVPIFFVISGFLISRSYERGIGDIKGYAWRRGLRIFPALWVCLIVTVIALASFGFLTADFMKSPAFPAWLAGQVSFVQFFNPAQFRGFGNGVANGALWTITVELQFYVFVPLLYATIFGKLRGNLGRALFAILTGVSFVLWCLMDSKVNGPGGYTEAPIVWKLLFVTLIPNLWMFSLGIFIHRHFEALRKWIEGKFLYYFAGYLLFMALHNLLPDHSSGWFFAGYFPSRVLLAFATISAAYSARFLSEKLLHGTDISYGIYIYHSVVINVLIQLHLMDSLTVVPLALATSAALAWLSWTFVEKPALACKSLSPKLIWQRIRKNRQPRTL